MGLLDRWFGKKQEVSIEEKLRGEMQRLVKESIMYGLPGTPAPGTLDFPSFEDGFWTPAGYYRNRSRRGDNPQAYINEDDLKRSRERSRLLAACNEYARNALAVRQAYIVGTGIKTTVMPVKGAEEDQAALKLAQDVQQYLERWSALVKLPKLQKETVLRCDRDGETFLRSYRRDALELRFVEPEHVGDYDGQTPFGIVTDEDDITEVLAYLVRAGDGEQYKKVKAEEVTHIKCNTDSGIKRGLPFLFPIFTILERIEKVDENMAAVIAIQAAIAMIRRNPAQKSTAISSAVSSNADFSRTNPYGGGTDYYKKYRAGTILDVDGNTEYEFPAIGANIGGIAEAKSSLLRTAAAGVCMAEYMITSDASNGNFASSQVAESPCISIFLATQHDFCEVFGNGAYVEGAENGIQWDAIEYAVEQGQLDPAALEMVVLKSVGPNIVVRDRTQETTRLSMLAEKGIISRDQWAKAEGEEKAAKSDEEVQAEKDAEMQKQAAMAQAKSKPAGVKEQFDEDKHPRDDDGKFASKGGEGEKKYKVTSKAEVSMRGQYGARHEEKVSERLKELFPDWDESDVNTGGLIASITGMPDDVTRFDTNVAFSDEDGNIKDNGEYLRVSVIKKGVTMQRLIGKDKGGVFILNKKFFLKEKGAGLGAELFSKQIESAASAGVYEIRCHAACTNDDGERAYNGFYTWPRMGYDQPLEGEGVHESDTETYNKAKKQFPNAKTVLDIMETEEGRTWWKKNGTDMLDAKFDLRAGSRSMKIHQAYMQEKKSKK